MENDSTDVEWKRGRNLVEGGYMLIRRLEYSTTNRVRASIRVSMLNINSHATVWPSPIESACLYEHPH